jgi:hypothetical protein
MSKWRNLRQVTGVLPVISTLPLIQRFAIRTSTFNERHAAIVAFSIFWGNSSQSGGKAIEPLGFGTQLAEALIIS